MRSRLLAGMGLLLVALGTTPAVAQSSTDTYFHEAAQHYINDDVSAARDVVEQGLEAAPSDPRLLALQKKLEQAGQSDGGDTSQEQAGSQDTPSNRKSSAGSSEEETEQEDGNRSRSSRQPETSSRQQGENESQSAFSNGAPTDREARQQGSGSSSRGAGALSRAQAERLLQALEGQEKKLLRELQTRSSEARSVEKDW